MSHEVKLGVAGFLLTLRFRWRLSFMAVDLDESKLNELSFLRRRKLWYTPCLSEVAQVQSLSGLSTTPRRRIGWSACPYRSSASALPLKGLQPELTIRLLERSMREVSMHGRRVPCQDQERDLGRHFLVGPQC